MANRAYSIEDGNTTRRTINQAIGRSYSDIDLAFENKPSGDIYKKLEVAAVKQAVKNILMTSNSERPFQPAFGANLGAALFELDTDYDPELMAELIASSIKRYEPRARVLNIDFTTFPDRNELRATIKFEVQNVGEVVSLDVDLARLR